MSLPSYYRHPYLGIVGLHYSEDPGALTLRFANEEVDFTFVRDGEFVDAQKRTNKCCLVRLSGAEIPASDLDELDVDDGAVAARTIRPKPAEPTDDVLRPFPELGPDVGTTDPVKKPTQPNVVA